MKVLKPFSIKGRNPRSATRKQLWTLRCIGALIFLSLTFGLVLAFYGFNSNQAMKTSTTRLTNGTFEMKKNFNLQFSRDNSSLVHKIKEQKTLMSTYQTLSKKKMSFENTDVSYNVHIFYYPWYGNPETDGHYFHWNHEYIPHWDKKKAKDYKTGLHEPPNDIGANFYPQIGPYSSKKKEVMDLQMFQMKRAGIGVVVVSWYPPATADQVGTTGPDTYIPDLLDAAAKYDLKLTLHIEPYKNRDISNLRKNFKYIRDRYFSHEAFYKHQVGQKLRPLLYIYDSYLITPSEWGKLFKSGGDLYIRDSVEYDITAIALLVEQRHMTDVTCGFDGFYTYFGSNGFSYGSSWRNWKALALFAYRNNLIFIPSVSPGYIDTMVRPWNSKTTRKRDNGKYYNLEWQAAINAPSKIISITSFNEWHEGTQIEPAIPKATNTFKYLDYLPNEPDFYLNLTYNWVKRFESTI